MSSVLSTLSQKLIRLILKRKMLSSNWKKNLKECGLPINSWEDPSRYWLLDTLVWYLWRTFRSHSSTLKSVILLQEISWFGMIQWRSTWTCSTSPTSTWMRRLGSPNKESDPKRLTRCLSCTQISQGIPKESSRRTYSSKWNKSRKKFCDIPTMGRTAWQPLSTTQVAMRLPTRVHWKCSKKWILRRRLKTCPRKRLIEYS